MSSDTIIAGAAVISAVAGATGAVAAWRAANASWRTSRDAAEALALAVQPRLWIRAGLQGPVGDHELVVRLKNVSDHDAVDVEIEVRMRDGQTSRERISRVRSTRQRTWKQIDRENDVSVILGPGESDPERVLVRFSDSRRLARYEREERYMVERYGPDARGLTGERRWTETREERIEGP